MIFPWWIQWFHCMQMTATHPVCPECRILLYQLFSEVNITAMRVAQGGMIWSTSMAGRGETVGKSEIYHSVFIATQCTCPHCTIFIAFCYPPNNDFSEISETQLIFSVNIFCDYLKSHSCCNISISIKFRTNQFIFPFGFLG